MCVFAKNIIYASAQTLKEVLRAICMCAPHHNRALAAKVEKLTVLVVDLPQICRRFALHQRKSVCVCVCVRVRFSSPYSSQAPADAMIANKINAQCVAMGRNMCCAHVLHRDMYTRCCGVNETPR